MIEIALNGIEKYYGASKVLSDVSFEVHSGDRIGLIGRNGTGKTTIFKLIMGIEVYEKGMLTIRKGASVGYLDQIPEFPDGCKVINVLYSAFSEILKVQKQMREFENEMSKLKGDELEKIMKKYSELQQLHEHMGGYEIEEKINKTCIGLKINEEFKDREFALLSGGEKTTVVLAKVLLQSPDILLLDEPTNHLDMESIEWLEGFLCQYPGTVMMVSHDRYFLDKVAKNIIEIEDGKSEIYNGNYSYYVDEKDRRLMAQFEAYQDQQKKIKAIERAIKELREWGNRGDNEKFFKRAENMQRRLDRMEKIQRPQLDRAKMQLDFSSGSRSGKEVIKISNLCMAFGDNIILKNLDFNLRYAERAGIIGKNGSGKSTLFKNILGEYTPNSGEIILGSNIRIGLLEQSVTFNDESKTILEDFREELAVSEGEARCKLARFLFYGEDVLKRVGSLSGGEKSRLKLCKLMYKDINLLILDEPTNHLDIDSREMLEDALLDFEGTILFISHDRYFLNKIALRILELENKSLESYEGNYDYYKEKRNQKLLECAVEKQTPPINSSKQPKPKNPILNTTSSRVSLARLEEKISELEKDILEKDRAMAKLSSDYERLQAIFEEKNVLQRELDTLMEEWINCNIG